MCEHESHQSGWQKIFHLPSKHVSCPQLQACGCSKMSLRFCGNCVRAPDRPHLLWISCFDTGLSALPIYLSILLVYCSFGLYICIAVKSWTTNVSARARFGAVGARLNLNGATWAQRTAGSRPRVAPAARYTQHSWLLLFRQPAGRVSKQRVTPALRMLWLIAGWFWRHSGAPCSGCLAAAVRDSGSSPQATNRWACVPQPLLWTASERPASAASVLLARAFGTVWDNFRCYGTNHFRCHYIWKSSIIFVKLYGIISKICCKHSLQFHLVG